MPEVKEYEPGTPSWIDIGSPDVGASAAFYSSLFGWAYEPAGPVEETGGYGMFRLRGKNVAGIGPKMDPDEPTTWRQYVTSADVTATAARVEAHGGTIVVPPMDVMTAGKMLVFTDPSGAACSVWQPLDTIGAELVNEHGAFTWSDLHTPDVGGSTSFYEHVFNWVANPMDMDGPPYTVWNVGERMIGGMIGDDVEPAFWDIWFAVDDCDAAVAEASGSGGSVLQAATDGSIGRSAVLADPHGARFGIITPAAS